MEGKTAMDQARALTRPDELAALDDAEPRLLEAAETRERIAKALLSEAGGFRQIIAGLRALRGEEALPPSPGSTRSGPDQDAVDDSPRGTEAIRRVMRAGGVWTVPVLHAELDKRGWVNPSAVHPEKATETAVHRLHKKGEVERVGRGQYRYAGEAPGSLTFDAPLIVNNARRTEP